MNIFDMPIDEAREVFRKTIEGIPEEQLYQELIECGFFISPNKYFDWSWDADNIGFALDRLEGKINYEGLDYNDRIGDNEQMDVEEVIQSYEELLDILAQMEKLQKEYNVIGEMLIALNKKGKEDER